MLPRELADHFLLTDITPPRNNSLSASTLLIIKMHRYPIVAASPRGQELFAVKVSKDTGATESPRKGPEICQWNWRCPVAPVVLAATPSLVGECICCSDCRCPVNFLWVNYFKCIQIQRVVNRNGSAFSAHWNLIWSQHLEGHSQCSESRLQKRTEQVQVGGTLKFSEVPVWNSRTFARVKEANGVMWVPQKKKITQMRVHLFKHTRGGGWDYCSTLAETLDLSCPSPPDILCPIFISLC